METSTTRSNESAAAEPDATAGTSAGAGTSTAAGCCATIASPSPMKTLQRNDEYESIEEKVKKTI